MKRLQYLKYVFIHIIEKIIGKPIQWGNVKFAQNSEKILEKKILSGEPFCLIRPGTAELSFACWWEEHELFHTKRFEKHKVYALFDKKIDNAEKWVKQFEKDMQESDVFAVLGTKSNYVIQRFGNNAQLVSANLLNLNMSKDSWLWSLAGKKVLIVSPFVESMKAQMERIDKVWGGDHVLKHVELVFQKSVWYTGQDMDSSGFESWQEAYQYLKTETLKHSFDIALLSCGSFSSFLAADLKRAGKQAIQYGGVLQILFGIRGKRWDEMDELKSIYNEYWIRPSQSECPKSQRSIKELDDGCYW